jgi:ATP phosphoribosyltransferase regulatory subunit
MLAMRSLESISEDYLLDLSHMSFIEGLLEEAGVSVDGMSDMLALVGSKNIPAIKAMCAERGISNDNCMKLCEVTSMYLPIEKALEKLESLVVGEKMSKAYGELCEIYKVMALYGLSSKLYLDFSVVNDMNYYDGIIFKGFINGIPDSILSGGRYDRLVEKFGKKTEAIGFAVYLDKLERIGGASDAYDIDIMLLYENDVPEQKIIEAVTLFSESGKTVRTVNVPDTSVRYRQLVKLGKEGIKILEAND